ncbi:MFS11 protein, partial [Polyodon spathula]|nr:MFS11 protein [Polyodon spathula]
MSIIYGVFSASNLIAPSVVAVIGPQISMFVCGLFYSAYIAVFIYPLTWSFYTASVLVGIAAAVLWTAQGNVLTINSTDTTIGRNSGIFWALLQFRRVFISLTVISLVGSFLFFLIRKPELESVAPEGTEALLQADLGDSSSGSTTPLAQGRSAQALDAFKKAVQLSGTKEMLLLSISIAYTGLELTFYSGVYGTCIGAMNQFGDDAKSLIGLSGIFIGVGEILAGLIDREWTENNVHINSLYRIQTKKRHVEVALLCSFLLGLGDSCFNTQLLSIVGFMFPQDSAPAFAVFKFIQSISAAVAFFYSNYLLLHWQLLIMVLTGFLGTLAFFAAERVVTAKRHDSDYDSI